MTNAGSVVVTVRTFVFLVVSSAALVVRWMVVVSSSSSMSISSSPPVLLLGGGGWRGAGEPHRNSPPLPPAAGDRRQEIVPRHDDRIHNTTKKRPNASTFLLPEVDEQDDHGQQEEHDPIGITVLCHMSGEMGNHLDIYAHCYALKRILEDRYYHHHDGDNNEETTKKELPLPPPPFRSGGGGGVTVVARRGYADGALHDLPRCFPHFRTVDFDEGTQSMYDVALVRQQKQLHHWERAIKKKNSTSHVATTASPSEGDDNGDDGENIKLGDFQLVHNAFVTMSTRHEPATVLAELDAFVDRLRESEAASAVSAPAISLDASRSHSSVHVDVPNDGDPSINPMSILYAQWLFSVDAFVDAYMDELREMYEFLDDSTDCCLAVPHPDETVFHLRNFVVEMPNRGKELGFQELSPAQTARDLFGHMPIGSRVAILSRFGIEHVQPYVNALTGIGLRVRVVEGQSGLQDFCFLRRAQFGMVGMAISTYFMWAAMLGDCPVVTAYSVDTTERRQMFGDGHVTYNFTHPLLKGRFAFPLIVPDDDDDKKRLI